MNTKFELNENFAETFYANSGKTTIERIALGMLAEAENYPVTFYDKTMLPSVDCCVPDRAFIHPWAFGINYNKDSFNKKVKANPEKRDAYYSLRDEMIKYCNEEQWQNGRIQEYITFQENDLCWGGNWMGHANPDFARILRLGTDGMRAYIEECREKNPDKDGFYNACKITMDALDVIGRNVRKTALENAENEADEGRRAEFLRIAEVFLKIPMQPCYDMYSAVMCFWVIFTLQNADSPGNFDRYMYEYFKKTDMEENRALIRRMLEGFQLHRSWNLCISGSDENWNDTTNELSYMLLEEITKTGYNTPNLTMRTHRNTPEKLWKLAVKSIAQGTGLPALYNDEIVCTALEKLGITPEDSHQYCMNGCNQIDILGKSHMGLEDGEVNLGKVLEICLHNGNNMLFDEPRKLLEPFGNARECKSFDELLELYFKYLDHVCDVLVDEANISTEMYTKINPNTIRSILIEGCLEKGIDYKAGGPKYNHAQILLEGIADTADSLWAIKKLVFIEKKYTMNQLVDALEDNFENWDDLYHDCKTSEKFGNDIDEVDSICAEVVNHFNRYLKTKKCARGGVYTGGCSTFDRAADRGIHTSALPNGKKKGEDNFADSISATPGCDVNGPTAAILSCLKYDQTEPCSGFVTQLKFTKSLFNTEKGQDAFITLAKTYFENGGQQLSINVVDRDTLLKAQKEPEKYKSLVVRVGGFSSYFCDLDEDLQNNVIARSEFSI